ncbi:putative TAP-like protein-domain-containing protein [Seiridium cardinale]
MRSAIQLALASAALAKPLTPRYAQNSTSGAINWGPCAFNSTVTVLCGSLEVPLDYTDSSSNETVSLDLVKVPAAATPSKGSILFNFGGPGEEAVQTLGVTYGAYLQNATGGYHDLIAFDPRGTANALGYSCFENDVERALVSAQYPLVAGDASAFELGTLWANSKILANYCEARTQNISELIGTAFVARDLMQVVDALGEDGLLRYWGFSYGSVLGATVAAMFPDRMDKLILDGVVNGHDYYHKSGIDVDQLDSADATFTAVLEECIKAGDRCALSQVNSTALELQATLMGLADDIKAAPIAVNNTVIDYNFVLDAIYYSIKYPSLFQTIAPYILDILNRQNLDDVVAFGAKLIQGATGGRPEALYGIKGSDTIPHYDNLAAAMPDIEYMQQASPLFWGVAGSALTLLAQWPFKAKEVYSGDFNTKTPNPILFIGNTWDPATSLSSARNMSASFEGSVVLEQHGYGIKEPKKIYLGRDESLRTLSIQVRKPLLYSSPTPTVIHRVLRGAGAPLQQPQEPDNTYLPVWQVNLKQSDLLRFNQLKNHVRQLKASPDIIAYQDPPNTLPYRLFPGNRMLYGSDRGLHEDNTPAVLKAKGKPEDIVRVHRVGFFVSNTIPTSALNFKYAHAEANRDKVTILDYTPSDGATIHVTNVYNVDPTSQDNRVDLELLLDEPSLDGRDLLLGDWNLHLPGICSSYLRLITAPYLVTWSRSGSVDDPGSTIDLAWAGTELTHLKAKASHVERLFYADHRVIAHHFTLGIICEYRSNQQWHKVDRVSFRDSVLQELGRRLNEETLEPMEATSQNYTLSQIECIAEELDDVIVTTMRDHVLMRTQHPNHDAHISTQLRLCKQLEQRARELYEEHPRRATERHWENCSIKLERQRIDKKQSPALHTAPQKIEYLRDYIWPDNNSTKSDSADTDKLKVPPTDQSFDIQFKQEATLEDVNKILHRLAKGKALGVSNVPNDALILLAAVNNEELIFETYLARLFFSCLYHEYFPELWRVAKTVFIAKTGKTVMMLLQASGPLHCQRLAELTIKHQLFPFNQFAFSNSSTEDALTYHFSRIFAIISSKKKHYITQMFLDMSRAYNKVVRQKLLDILARKGIPKCVLAFLCSFLSDRRTTIAVPGYESVEMSINVGIAQGSPLSSILFAFYTSPILEYLANKKNAISDTRFFCWCYADDFYIIVWSESYKSNCRGLTEIHEVLMAIFGKELPQGDLDRDGSANNTTSDVSFVEDETLSCSETFTVDNAPTVSSIDDVSPSRDPTDLDKALAASSTDRGETDASLDNSNSIERLASPSDDAEGESSGGGGDDTQAEQDLDGLENIDQETTVLG